MPERFSFESVTVGGLAVDVVEADAFRVLVVQNFDGVAVHDGDDGA